MISRETQVTQSVEDYVRERIFGAGGYTADQVVLMDAFPVNGFDGPLDKTYVACSYNFDDGGKVAECGSNLKVRKYAISFYIFANTPDMGENVATVVKAAVEADGVIPFKNYGEADPPQVTDALVLDAVTAARQWVREPQPWEENVWMTVATVEDTYYPQLG